MKKESVQFRVQELCNKYRNEGGFGIYSVDRLCARGVDIKEQIYQEDTIIELYSAVYCIEIGREKLENNYLGRNCASVYDRCSLQLQYGIPKECVIPGEDPFITFTKKYRVDGHINRLHRNENIIERNRFTVKELIIIEEKEEKEEEYVWSQPIFTRSLSSTKII